MKFAFFVLCLIFSTSNALAISGATRARISIIKREMREKEQRIEKEAEKNKSVVSQGVDSLSHLEKAVDRIAKETGSLPRQPSMREMIQEYNRRTSNPRKKLLFFEETLTARAQVISGGKRVFVLEEESLRSDGDQNAIIKGVSLDSKVGDEVEIIFNARSLQDERARIYRYGIANVKTTLNTTEFLLINPDGQVLFELTLSNNNSDSPVLKYEFAGVKTLYRTLAY